MKIVNNNLFEFKKGLDPVDSMRLGRKALIEDWLKTIDIVEYEIEEDFRIYAEMVYITGFYMPYFPEYIQFSDVRCFYIQEVNLKSLRGCPTHVSEHFSCWNNNLTSLAYSPITVGGNFFCGSNELTSLKYAPKIIKGRFSLNCNRGKTFQEDDFKRDNPKSKVKVLNIY